MKKIVFAVFCAGACFFSLALPAFAQQSQDVTIEAEPVIDTDRIDYERTPVNKLGRGITNILTFWLEVPAEIYRVSEEKNIITGTVLGLLQGIATGTLRLATGIFDGATCLIPPYDQPLMHPEYAFDDVKNRSQEYSRDIHR